jgi:hypothetical protein
MFRTSHTVKTLAAPEEIWELVEDASRWKTWLPGVDMVQLHGPLTKGTQGLLFLGGETVHQMVVHDFDLGRLEILVNLSFGVKMRLMVDISSLPTGSQVKMEGELLGNMAILHIWGWGRNLKMGIVPTTRRLGILGQETHI